MTRNTETRLTFRKGLFILESPGPRTRAELEKNPEWRRASSIDYGTRSLQAAVAFRSHSDETVGKIFNRVFQSYYPLPKLPPLPGLDVHQRAGLEWALTRKRSYLAHAPGAGKTLQAILAAYLAPGEGQVLFIVPPSLTGNWRREVEKFTEWLGIWPVVGVVPRSAEKDEMPWRADVIICPDSMLTKPWVYPRLLAMKKKLIAVDEASRFKEAATDRSLAFYGGRSKKRAYPGLFQKARHVVFLDGSPMPNRPMELWAPTYALSPATIDCMTQRDFGFKYCGPEMNERGEWEFKRSSNEAELKKRLRADFMHVVGEDELDHPERLRSILFMNEDVRSREHRTWERKHLAGLNLDDLDEEDSQGDLARFRRELGIRKIPWVANYAAERLESKKESILLFAWHREVCKGLADILQSHQPGLIMGGVPASQRDEDMDRFQRGKTRLLIMNIAAGGRGHNLQKADRVLFGEYSWTNETNIQCEKRASRRGSLKRRVRCEYITVPNSMDERILRSVFTKEQRVKRVIG